ncbi:hypothetical protein AK812_SmicGene28901 [Symbiodinium microadriaticum]|uniref:Uncharacterized protein n=1 Tax=Symbiodinium microadriaticum TaxID=2951 RepID=A0A1Q9D385_SYMMI|nr:hypothetical protein AK812_SmicGene28901 [Symbiodinium microadriaticum]
MVEFANVNLSMHAAVPRKLAQPYLTEVVILPDELVFPLKDECERMNSTLGGLNDNKDLQGKAINDKDDVDRPSDGGNDDDNDDGDDDSKGKPPPEPAEADERHGVEEMRKRMVRRHLLLLCREPADLQHMMKWVHPEGLFQREERKIQEKSYMETKLAPDDIEHWSSGTKGDGKIYVNDDGEACKIDKCCAPYKAREKAYKKAKRERAKEANKDRKSAAVGKKLVDKLLDKMIFPKIVECDEGNDMQLKVQIVDAPKEVAIWPLIGVDHDSWWNEYAPGTQVIFEVPPEAQIADTKQYRLLSNKELWRHNVIDGCSHGQRLLVTGREEQPCVKYCAQKWEFFSANTAMEQKPTDACKAKHNHACEQDHLVEGNKEVRTSQISKRLLKSSFKEGDVQLVSMPVKGLKNKPSGAIVEFGHHDFVNDKGPVMGVVSRPLLSALVLQEEDVFPATNYHTTQKFEMFREMIKVIKDGISKALEFIAEDRNQIRFDLNETAATTVRLTNFFNEALVANNREYCARFPGATGGINYSSEDDLVQVAKMSIRFAKCVAYGIRTHNSDIDSRSWPTGAKPAYIDIYDVVIQVRKAFGNDIEPLAFAASYMQAYLGTIRLIHC